MKRGSWFENVVKGFQHDFDYRLESIIWNLTEGICRRMKEEGINKSKLSEKLNVTPAAVTKILDGNSNFTIKTLLSLSDALNSELRIEFDRKEQVAEAIDYRSTIEELASACDNDSFVFHRRQKNDFNQAMTLAA